jgi:predicted metal-dependent hydrolase
MQFTTMFSKPQHWIVSGGRWVQSTSSQTIFTEPEKIKWLHHKIQLSFIIVSHTQIDPVHMDSLCYDAQTDSRDKNSVWTLIFFSETHLKIDLV